VNEPTNGEVMRRVEELIRQVQALADLAREDRRHAAETYVRRDVYEANRATETIRSVEAQKDMDEIQRHREVDAQWRRQMVLAVSGLAIASLISIAGIISNYLAR